MDEHIEKDVDRIRVENRVQYLLQLVVVECNSNSRKYYAPQPEALSKLHAYIPVQRICFFDGVIASFSFRDGFSSLFANKTPW